MPKRDSNFNPIPGSRGVRRGQQGIADWASADSAICLKAVCAASIVGGAIRFGYSRDGGAYAIGIYGDGEPYTEFVRPSENIDDFMSSVIELFESIADHPRNSDSRAEGKKQPPNAT